MYQHLQSSIIFPLLLFLPWAMVPRIVVIWRSNQIPQAAFQGCWNRRCQGWEWRKASLWFTNSAAAPHKLQQIFCDVVKCYEEWKASCDSVGMKTLQTRKTDVLRGRVLQLWTCEAEGLKSDFRQTLPMAPWILGTSLFEIIWSSRSHLMDAGPLGALELLHGICRACVCSFCRGNEKCA